MLIADPHLDNSKTHKKTHKEKVSKKNEIVECIVSFRVYYAIMLDWWLHENFAKINKNHQEKKRIKTEKTMKRCIYFSFYMILILFLFRFSYLCFALWLFIAGARTAKYSRVEGDGTTTATTNRFPTPIIGS